MPAPWDINRCFREQEVPGQEELVKVATLQGLECIFANLLQIALVLAGLVLFIMLVVGGFRYLTSGGDPKAKEAAQGTLTHAIAGLVILLLAFVILRFIAFITGVESILKFTIVQPSP